MAEKARVKDKESLTRDLQEAVRSGDLERVKRVADVVHGGGVDPIAILANIIKAAQPDSPVRNVAVDALESLDSSAMKKFVGTPDIVDSFQEPEELDLEAPVMPSSEEAVEPARVFHFWIREKALPVTVEEIESLLMERAITAESLACGEDSEWRFIREIDQLGQPIRNAYNALYGPRKAVGVANRKRFVDMVNCRLGRHNFVEWRYVGKVDCETRWFCEHCRTTRSGEVRHIIGPTMYLKDKECKVGKRCLRCTFAAVESVKHEWGEWAFPDLGSCNTARTCARCGTSEAGETKHSFGLWEKYDECCNLRKCKRCGKYDFSYHHSWGVWNYESPTSCLQVRFCRRCHEEEQGSYECKWLTVKNPYGDGTMQVCTHCGNSI